MGVLMRNSGQKRYSVICMNPEGDPLFTSVEVFADNESGAEMMAQFVMMQKGYPNTRIAPKLPGTEVVKELPTGSDMIFF